MDACQTPKRPVPQGTASPPKSRTQGPVRFPPFEHVGAQAMQDMAPFHITPLGHIQQHSEHIPYNSTKKNFYKTTGRESIEAFKYEFRLPGQQASFRVMWDYNIGLVRMTPFFKCLGYPKTKPSQMLDKNPGLREISPGITGGSVRAQGYWVPYQCARAVCATFCHDIAGALIPLFGPGFPLECTPPESHFFADMVIDHQLVQEAAMEAEASRQVYESRKAGALNPSASHQGASFPRPLHQARSGLEAPPRPPARATPRISDCSRPPDAPTSVRGTVGLETRQPCQGGETGLPPMHSPDHENQLFQPNHGLDMAESPRRAVMGPAASAEPWVFKRPRSSHECLGDTQVPARAKAARISAGEALQREHEAHDDGRKTRAGRRAREDYAAAAVLVGLQATGSDAAADDVTGSCSGTSPGKM